MPGIARVFGTVARRKSSASFVDTFVQDPPQLKNVFLQDITLKSFFSRYVPEKTLPDAHEDLKQFGEQAAVSLPALARQCEVEEPWLEQYDAFGRRVDKLHTSSAWKRMHEISAEEGLVAIAQENHGDFSRLYQVCKLMLFGSASGLYSCPLAMTDGGVKVLQGSDSPVRQLALKHLLSRSPDSFWTSGQWMTEKRGGSDVAAGTSTIAVPTSADSSEYLLSGYKWFTSASDANIALTLGRSLNSDGQPIQGNKGLSLYYVDVKENFRCGTLLAQRLKDKLGTRQLPTAELQLEDCVATKLSETGRGIQSISPMLTITRLHNAISAVSAMRRIILLARDYCDRRVAFGGLLRGHPLHVQTLARMEVECRGCTVMMLEVARLLSLQEKGKTSPEQDALLRVLVPLAKLYTGKQAVAVASEGLEAFGGLGYLEDSSLPVILRDAQVLPIWEGTTNILSLDVLRAIASTKNTAFVASTSLVSRTAADIAEKEERLAAACDRLRQQNKAFSEAVGSLPADLHSVAARDIAFSLSRLIIGSLLLDHACYTSQDVDIAVANRWCNRTDLCVLANKDTYSASETSLDSDIVFKE